MSEEHITLPEHEKHSEHRVERVLEAVHQQCAPSTWSTHSAPHHEAHKMSEGMSDKVEVKNIFEPGRGGGHDGGLNAMAAIAALGNRNEQSASAFLPAMAMMGHRGHDGYGLGGGLGAGLVGGLIGGALFGGRGRGGLFGGGGECSDDGAETRVENSVFNTAVLGKLGTIEGAIPLASAQTENVVLQQTNALTNALASLALGTQQAFGNTKDTVQNVGALNLSATNNVNQNVLEQGCQTRAAVAAAATAILSRIDRFEIDDLRHRAERNERQVEIQSLRSNIEVNQTVNTTQQQAQQQSQWQFQLQDMNNRLGRLFDRVDIVHQEQKSTNANIIAGNSGAVVTGPQTSTPTAVNAR